MSAQYWYAKPGTKYHKAAPDWMRTGKAICGADISRPAWTRDLVSDAIACKRCRTIEQTCVEYEIQVNYGHGHGWEHEITETDRGEARARLREYRENATQYQVRMVKRRTKLEGVQS